MYVDPRFTVIEKQVSIMPPSSCNAVSVVDVTDGHCWTLVYRPPDCTAEDTAQLCSYLDCVLTNHKSVTILGDFNMDQLTWHQPTAGRQPNAIQRKFSLFCTSWDLHQLVNRPTRGQNMLDLILTTHPERYGDITIEPPLVNSDHDTIICHMVHLHSPSKAVLASTRSFDQADFNAIKLHLSRCHWPTLFAGCTTVNDYWSVFFSIMRGLIDAFVPLRHQGQGRKSVLPKEIRQAIHAKRRARKRWMRSPNQLTKSRYNSASRQCSHIVRSYIATQEANLLNMKPSKFYAYVSKLLHPCASDIFLQSPAGPVTKAEDICKVLSCEFARNFAIPSSYSYGAHVCEQLSVEQPTLTIVNIDEATVRRTLEQLKNSAPGPDGLPASLLKELASYIALPLTIIFQQSMHQACIPDAWREALVIALYKNKGGRHDPASYRPISLTSTVCKIMERIVGNQLRAFLVGNNRACQEQHGFVPGRSTLTNLLLSDYVISELLNAREACDVVFIDFAKAFDKVSHNVLQSKLAIVGVTGKLHAWLTDFLNNRTQRVIYQGVKSAPVRVSSGVVQGSVLGPLLFTIMVSDLPAQVTHSQMVLYADDGKTIGRASSLQDCLRLQSDLDAINDWSIRNELPLSKEKCVCLHLGYKNAHHSYNIGGVPLMSPDNCGDLGIMRSHDFTYNLHIESMVSRAARCAGMMYRAFCTRDEQFMKQLFTTYVRPVLEYASPLWSPIYVGLDNDIERVQRRFTKQLYPRTSLSYSERLERLGLVELRVRRHRADLITVFKALHGLLGVDASSIGISRSTAPTRSNGLDLTVHRAYTNIVAKTLHYRVVNKWNDLPTNAKTTNSINCFKRLLN